MKQQKPTSLDLCTNKVRETRGVSEKAKLHGLSLAVKTNTKFELVGEKKARQKKEAEAALPVCNKPKRNGQFQHMVCISLL